MLCLCCSKVTLSALALAELCYKTLLADGEEAVAAVEVKSP